MLLQSQYSRTEAATLDQSQEQSNNSLDMIPTGDQLAAELQVAIRALQNKHNQLVKPGEACTNDTTGLHINYGGKSETETQMFE